MSLLRLLPLVPILMVAPISAQEWSSATSAGGSETDATNDLAVDAAGNAYVVGTFEGTAHFGPFALTSVGSEDVFVAKYAPSGEVLWARRGGGVGDDSGAGVAVGTDGDVYVTGRFGYPGTTATFGTVTLTSAGASDIFLVRYSADGDVLWARGAGGTETDRGTAVAVDLAGEVCVTGAFSSIAAFGSHTLTSAGYTDAFLARYTPDGDVLWAERGGSAGGGDGARGVAVDAAGNAYIVGSFSGTATFGVFTLPSAGFPDAFLVRYSPGGDVLWARGAGGGATDLGLGVAADAAGNAYVTGYFQGSAAFGDFTLVGTGYINGFVARYDPSGEVLWVEPANASASHAVFIMDVAVDAGGDVTVTGGFSGTVTLGPYTLTNVGSGVGNTDVVLARYAASGEVVWAERAGGPGGAGGNGVALDASGEALVAGSFTNTASFDSHTLTSVGSSDAYLARFNSSPPTPVEEDGPEPAGGFTVSAARPNPFNPQTSFTLAVYREQHMLVEVADALGRRVQTLFRGRVGAGERHELPFGAEHLPPGVYLVRARGEGFTAAQRVTRLR